MSRLLAVLALLALAVPARAETLIASLSTSRVAITSNYTGASIVVFGAIERDAQTIARAGPYDIVVTVRGPRHDLVVREKDSLGPIWINRDEQRFPNAPLFIAVLSSRPLGDVTTETTRRRLRVGLDAIVHATDFAAERGQGDDPFRQALARLMAANSLYIENPRGATFLTPSLFRAAVPLPAVAPPGNYEVDVLLFADNVLLARAQTHFELVKIGFEQQMAAVAREWAWLYGLGVGLMALGFGWLASVIFRRD
jgi:uncharacterized protein (TIGR02186 family)